MAIAVDEILEMAQVFAPALDEQETAALKKLCAAAGQGLQTQLRPGLDEEEYRDSFVCAAAWIALAALSEGRSAEGITGFTAGSMSVQRSTGAGSCLRLQAQMLMAPYLGGSGFAFLGV